MLRDKEEEDADAAAAATTRTHVEGSALALIAEEWDNKTNHFVPGRSE